MTFLLKADKAVFAEREPLRFKVTLKNEGEDAVYLFDIDWQAAHPEMYIEPGPAGKNWTPFSTVEVQRKAPTPENSKLLKPGELRDVTLDLSRVFYSWTRDIGDPLVPENRNHLPPGKYNLVVTLHFVDNPTAPPGGWKERHWVGDLTEKVAFEIGDKAAEKDGK